MKDSGFSSKMGYILAAAGSAVGLGNIWRFPYLAARYGGGIFLLTYLVLVLTFGYTMLLLENSIGRMTGKGPIGAFRELCAGKPSTDSWLKVGGFLNSLAPLLITPYYCVIGGWVLKYLYAVCTTPISTFSKDVMVTVGDKTVHAAENYFSAFLGSAQQSVIFFLVFVFLLLIIPMLGVQKGIERSSKVMMPLLVLVCLALAVYSCILPGAGEGLKYYLMPDWNKFSLMTVVAAMGQLFFSLSIAMGIMVTYGSYMRKEENMISCMNQVQLFDTGVAFMAGLMIIPALISFGGPAAAQHAGPGLVFVVMPQVFASFWGGQYVAIFFFLLVLLAAATSAISLFETNVQTISQELKVSRGTAVFISLVEVLIVGSLVALDTNVLSKFKWNLLDNLDFYSNNLVMPLAAIFTVQMTIFVVGLDNICHEITGGGGIAWKRRSTFMICAKYIVIPCLLIILLNALGVIKG